MNEYGEPMGFDDHQQAYQNAAERKRAKSNGEADGWLDPQPLGGELPPVADFDSHLMPAALTPLIEDTAERMQVPLDYPAVVTVLSLAGVTGRRARMQVKVEDVSWVVVPNLWGGIVAPPGLMKSPVINAVTAPLREIEKLWRMDYESSAGEYKQQKEEAELRHAAWKQQYVSAQKGGKEAPLRPDTSIAEPVCPRLITQDATFERLHEILRDNPAGVLLIRDELSGWLATLDKFGRESDRGFFLSAWNGDTGYTMDRIGRRINPCGSLLRFYAWRDTAGAPAQLPVRYASRWANQRRSFPALPSAHLSRRAAGMALCRSCSESSGWVRGGPHIPQAGAHGCRSTAKSPLRSCRPRIICDVVDGAGGEGPNLRDAHGPGQSSGEVQKSDAFTGGAF